MTVDDVVELIQERKKKHLHPTVGDDTGDPLRWSEGGFQRAVVEEYDALLDQIKNVEMKAGSR